MVPAGSGVTRTAEEINGVWQKPWPHQRREGGSVQHANQFTAAGGSLTGYADSPVCTQLQASTPGHQEAPAAGWIDLYHKKNDVSKNTGQLPARYFSLSLLMPNNRHSSPGEVSGLLPRPAWMHPAFHWCLPQYRRFAHGRTSAQNLPAVLRPVRCSGRE